LALDDLQQIDERLLDDLELGPAFRPDAAVVSLGTVGGQKAKRLIEKRWKAATSSDDLTVRGGGRDQGV
jgi:hypothetical protein